nr:DUF47 family protein [Aliamphritea spongicola]
MVTNNSIFQLFASSPFKPMQEHIAKAHACAIELIPFFEAVMADDWEKAEQLQQNIARLENEADTLKRMFASNCPVACSCRYPVPICWTCCACRTRSLTVRKISPV